MKKSILSLLVSAFLLAPVKGSSMAGPAIGILFIPLAMWLDKTYNPDYGLNKAYRQQTDTMDHWLRKGYTVDQLRNPYNGTILALKDMEQALMFYFESGNEYLLDLENTIVADERGELKNGTPEMRLYVLNELANKIMWSYHNSSETGRSLAQKLYANVICQQVESLKKYGPITLVHTAKNLESCHVLELKH